MEYYGYAGRTLFADLSGHRTWSEPLDPSLMKKFVGGPGFGFELLARLLKPGVDPLSPDAPIVAGLGRHGRHTGPRIGPLLFGHEIPGHRRPRRKKILCFQLHGRQAAGSAPC